MLTTPMRDGPPADVTIRNVRATEYGIKENKNGREQMNQKFFCLTRICLSEGSRVVPLTELQ